MKTSITRLSSKVFLLALLPSLAHAVALVGKVQSVQGEAFLVEGKNVRTLRADMDIHEGAKLLVGDGAKLTIGDFYDNRHHLASGTHATVENQGLVLQKGAVWTQAYSGRSNFTTTTPNMLAMGRKGEWVVTYNVANQRTQLTTITGEVDVASPQEPAFKYAVSAGMFTMSDPKVEDGYPRSPTKLGYDSLMKTVALFPGVKSQDAGFAQAVEKAVAKAPAVPVEDNAARAPASITVSEPAATIPEVSAHQYFTQKVQAKPRKTVAKVMGSTAPVRVIGFQQVSKPVVRQPASKAKVQPQAHAPRGNEADFMKSYEQHQRNQPKHSQEVQRLVDDLKSF